MKTKGQIKMGETIAILFIFFVLVLFGLIFYFQFQKSSLASQKIEVFAKESITKSLLVSFLPELSCSQSAGSVSKDCVDLLKLKFAKETIAEEKEYYFNMLGWMTVWLEEVYPGRGNSYYKEVIYSQVPLNLTRNSSSAAPVSLYWPIEKTYSFGVLHVETYS